MSAFRSDCSRCCGLCCVAPAHFAFQGFGSDKPAHTPCPSLGPGCHCTIYPVRESHGYSACAGFDCYGAGQWVTQTLFRGASWRDSPALADTLFTAYRHCLPLFELAAMLDAALPHVESAARSRLCDKRDALLRLCAQVDPYDEAIQPATVRREVREIIQVALKYPLSGSDQAAPGTVLPAET